VVIQENSVLDAFDIRGRIELKNHVQISRNSLLKSGKGRIEIGESVYVGPNAVFYGIGGIRIGAHCLIANNVQLLSGNHVYKDRNRLIKTQGAENHPIVIGEDVWLGASVIVLAGVTIGRGAVIGAGSVVRKDIPEYGIAVGNPARVVRTRGG
jgi:acetyltransferase-like isoleucine patch superfamily enzyme